jgi:hypothetical protein
MSRNGALAILGIPALLLGFVACGNVNAPESGASAPTAGHSVGIAMSLRTVPTIRSITVSPRKAKFSACAGGLAINNTQSTSDKLGFPNGVCYSGTPGSSFPITITNTGIAAAVYVSGSNAIPSDGGTSWALCNLGDNPVVACSGLHGKTPGTNQYAVQNFAPNQLLNTAGLTATPTCDMQFGGGGQSHCLAGNGASQTEGLRLIGPWSTDDSSTKWTVTVTWIPVPPG